MMFSKSIAVFLLLPFALAAPTSPNNILEARQSIDTSTHCGQWDTVNAGTYTFFQNLWGAGGASSGSQCGNLVSLSGSTIAWKTTWTWTGGNGVKSYSNIQQNQNAGKQLSAISSIPSTWSWSQSTSGNVVGNVAYDLFTASTPTGNNENEIMIWLANLNAGPISAQYNSDGTPKPTASNVSIAGHTWNLYFGSNGANNVYSFLPTNNAVITNFSGDINAFLKFLTSSQGVSSSQYLKTAQAGTEPTSGSATLTTSAYSLVIN
ncbi:hypothetical protein PC9H_002000 [Pleurotus ostreatus]|uniref:Glycoside hydrolase family 12 protein n=2 Tax=Pleurotus ostreatus TaxID=5322 RepID=A0A8H6ZHQ4_PLEOS|nr:uncharacterized protein PC9H_002000 [Pleurotus ostreatus]KAF7419410.1 hypothetical protein PC9H_002000 [Pleurotus ostreatus]KAJ8689795.1 hypothetical protein PTI98_012657 [Pleurotus ostreatus]